MESINGKKTYISVIAGAVAALALFVQAGHYDFQSILALVNGEAVLAAIAALRSAIGKK